MSMRRIQLKTDKTPDRPGLESVPAYHPKVFTFCRITDCFRATKHQPHTSSQGAASNLDNVTRLPVCFARPQASSRKTPKKS